ncbi:hypothetical protein KSD_62140 [Ktedonobacter sp. SOSP1-85]|uniref:C2H2-type domain-containing protein n=2 Tax=Ktedonobacter TaxID=363276 RepID=D6TFE9_KTERA|nr:hypothetical protein [Ktedonobacter sp. SOSP1-85]EFH88629.1 hypothetical protein Krac_10108 [Ktedonobacter racemifer DSM 44963]GHO56736.1 hypothetical protein KSB_52110 [Ktedonobacter robiniae]GHO78443.1 hypothetical protein KSD_62140 [Ktedonobacter sp. SOSP1-85]
MDPLNNPNAFAVSTLPILLVILLVVLVFNLLDKGWWKCSAPGCDFRTRSEEEALGHQAKHAQHKAVLED